MQSKRTGNKYYYKSDTNTSTYEVPNDDWYFSNPKNYLESGFVWKWMNEELQNEDVDSDNEAQSNSSSPNTVTKQKFVEFLEGYKFKGSQ